MNGLATIQTLGPYYQKDCQLFDTITSISSSLTISANKMSSNSTYLVALVVSTSDGRHSSASVTIKPVEGDIVISASSTTARINFDQKLLIVGYISANSSVHATWTASFSSIDQDISMSSTPLIQQFPIKDAQ